MNPSPQPASGRVLVAVSGGIAAYKVPELVRQLVRAGHEVRCVLTEAAAEFVSPMVLQTLTGAPARTALFDPGQEGEISHIELADWADAVLVAPATADLLARMAHGLANDLVTTVLLATRAPVLVAPAMNVNMWRHPATQENLERLCARGVQVEGPEAGELACGWEGEGRMSDPETLAGRVGLLVGSGTWQGVRLLVSAGGTREPIDAVRSITNRSSGKMGFAIAAEAARRGAEVDLVAGPCTLQTPPGVTRSDVSTALEMEAAVRERFPACQVAVMTAAVADFRPRAVSERKIKKEDLAPGEGLRIDLVPNPDILAGISAERGERVVVGFAAESHDLVAAARRKLERKGCDLLVANDVSREDAGLRHGHERGAVRLARRRDRGASATGKGRGRGAPARPHREAARSPTVRSIGGWLVLRVSGLLTLLGALLMVSSAMLAEDPPTTSSGPILVVRIDGSINPASSDYLQKAIRTAEERNARALLLEMDTPGGLVTSTQDIIKAMLRAKIPVIVYVAPQGAWAGSAGTFITLAGHVAAMAPGSTIGAAHPVGVGGGGGPTEEGEDGQAADHSARKAENMLAAYIKAIAEERGRNVEWAQEAVRDSVAVTADKALELGVIDLVAKDRADLFAQLEGREIEVAGEPVVLTLTGAATEELEMELLTRIMNVLASPDLAVLLFMAGLLGLYVEMNQPGLIVPGVAGAICLVLALIAFQILPFSWVGFLLMLAGLGLMIAEAFVTSFGLLFIGGAGLLLLGGSMIFDQPELSDLDVSFWPVLVPAVGGMGAFGALVVWAVGRSMGRPQESGVSEMVGMHGMARTDLDPSGTVFIRGEFWSARSDEPIAADTQVVAERVEGLILRVRAADHSD